MLTNLKNRFHSLYLKTISSIAFYPTIIAIVLTLLAVLTLTLEDNETTNFLIDNFPFLVINNAETARTILGTLIGGIISLTVFSFSMVMVLLNQASSSFSPRLLPGLISDRMNQTVLGIYLGTIVYNIIVLISIVPTGDEYTLNGFSVLLGIVLGIISLSMFVYFIHSISTNIQISIILEKIFNKTRDRLIKLTEIDKSIADEPIYNDDEYKSIYAHKAKYYQGVNMEGLKDFVDQHELTVRVIPYKGKYVLPNQKTIMYKGQLDNDQIKTLNSFLIYSNSIDINDNYVLGIKQITEVGVKAMSPGINDPGTAVITLDYITELFALRMQMQDREIYTTENKHTIELATVNFADLLYQSLAAYRQYCKHDIILMEKVIMMIQYLINRECTTEKYHSILKENMEILKEDINTNIENQYDRKMIETKLSIKL